MITNYQLSVLQSSLITLSMLIAGISMAHSHGQDDHHETESPAISEKDALVSDIKLVAQAEGWSFDDTNKHISTQDHFNKLVRELATVYPRIYAGASVGSAPGVAATIYFKDKAPRAVLEQLKQESLHIEIVEGQPFSDVEQRARVTAIMEQIKEQGFKDAAIELLPDGRIEVLVADEKERTPKLTEDLREGVSIEQTRLPLVELDHGRGGARARTGNCSNGTVGNGICTTGFSVVNASGTTGVTLAAHCNGFTNYIDPVGPDFCMSHVTQHIGVFGDIEWKTTTHIEPAEFFARSNEIRSVTSRAALLLPGTSTCLYGRTSNNRTCETVRSSFAAFIVNGTLAFGFVTTNRTVSQGGDSGGPWSFSNRADGSNTGRIFGLFATRGVLTPVYNFNAAIGVNVRIAP